MLAALPVGGRTCTTFSSQALLPSLLGHSRNPKIFLILQQRSDNGDSSDWKRGCRLANTPDAVSCTCCSQPQPGKANNARRTCSLHLSQCQCLVIPQGTVIQVLSSTPLLHPPAQQTSAESRLPGRAAAAGGGSGGSGSGAGGEIGGAVCEAAFHIPPHWHCAHAARQPASRAVLLSGCRVHAEAESPGTRC